MNRSMTVRLLKIDIELQSLIDEFIALRQNAAIQDKALYRYVGKKVDIAGKAIEMALDKIESGK